MLDIVLAGLALVVALPVLGLAALAVRMTMGRPIMFHQERIGLDGRPLTVLKLRTMKPDRRRGRLGPLTRVPSGARPTRRPSIRC